MQNQPVITKKAANALQLGKNGSYSNEGNVLQHTLYDSNFFQNTTLAAKTRFFSVPQGGAKTLTETNLEDSGKLPNGQTFIIEKIGFALKAGIAGADTNVNVVLAAYYNIMQNSVFEVKIAGREYDLQVPGTRFLNPVQVAGLDSAANGINPVGNYISSGSIKLGATPIPIGNLVSFSVTMNSGSGLGALATILDTASDDLNTQNAQLECQLTGVLTRLI